MNVDAEPKHAARRPSLKDFSRASLREVFQSRGWPAYRADQVATWLYKHDAD
jgi:adenine C2-methylase RlmN of 23S rRNA A2503 and tRNA A37